MYYACRIIALNSSKEQSFSTYEIIRTLRFFLLMTEGTWLSFVWIPDLRSYVCIFVCMHLFIYACMGSRFPFFSRFGSLCSIFASIFEGAKSAYSSNIMAPDCLGCWLACRWAKDAVRYHRIHLAVEVLIYDSATMFSLFGCLFIMEMSWWQVPCLRVVYIWKRVKN